MLISPKLYNPRCMSRFRYAQIAAVLIAAAACGYLAVTTFSEIRDVWQAKRSLARDAAETRSLRREVARLRKAQAARPPMKAGGVDTFAASFAAWARQRDVTVESMVPEGSPAPAEIEVGESKLGVWNANKVRIRGQGTFAGVMDLLTEFRSPDIPVQLESFVFLSSCSGSATQVSFDLLLTIYEKKSDAI